MPQVDFIHASSDTALLKNRQEQHFKKACIKSKLCRYVVFSRLVWLVRKDKGDYMAGLEEMTFNARDEFQRESIAKNLIKLFESDTINISPTVIDAPWGSGKSEFCHKLKNLANESGTKNKYIYIDAYRYDHSDDPLLMLITSITINEKRLKIKNDIIKKAIPVFKVMGKVFTRATVSLLLRQNADNIVAEIAEAIDSKADDALDSGVEKIFEDFEKAEASLKLFQDALERASKSRPLVIIIDELDRCKPTFALDLLEKLKHVFDIKGVQFLLSTNIKQLESAVKKQYGHEIDAETYLGKFFKLKVHLPESYSTDRHHYHDNAYTLFAKSLRKISDYETISSDNNLVMKKFKYLINKDRRSLRDVEKYIYNLKIYNTLAPQIMRVSKDTLSGYSALYMLAVYIHTFDTRFKRKLLDGTYTEEDLSLFFRMEKGHLSPENAEYDLQTQMYGLLMLEMKKHWEKFDINTISISNLKTRLSHTFPGLGQGERLALTQKALRILDFCN